LHTKYWIESLKGRGNSEDLGIDGTTVLKWMLMYSSGRVWTGFICGVIVSVINATWSRRSGSPYMHTYIHTYFISVLDRATSQEASIGVIDVAVNKMIL
jgi:type IV secretory pathway VirB6-like protein